MDMNVKDFIALATAMAAARRFEKVTSNELWVRKGDGTCVIDRGETMQIARECNALAIDLVDVIEEQWEEDEQTVEFGGHKEKDNELFFDDPQEFSPLGMIAHQLEEIEDSLSHGKDSIGGSLRRLAEAHGSYE